MRTKTTYSFHPHMILQSCCCSVTPVCCEPWPCCKWNLKLTDLYGVLNNDSSLLSLEHDMSFHLLWWSQMDTRIIQVCWYLPLFTFSDQLVLVCVLHVILTGHHSVTAGGGAWTPDIFRVNIQSVNPWLRQNMSGSSPLTCLRCGGLVAGSKAVEGRVVTV